MAQLLLPRATIDRAGLVYRLAELKNAPHHLSAVRTLFRLADELGVMDEFAAELDRQNQIAGVTS